MVVLRVRALARIVCQLLFALILLEITLDFSQSSAVYFQVIQQDERVLRRNWV